MIRFIKNILDIKNLLGMQRPIQPIPDPAYPANEMVLRTNGNTVTFTPIFTGTIYYRYTYNGTTSVSPYTDDYSGMAFSNYCDNGTDVVITGNVTQIDVDNDIEFVALNNTVANLSIFSSVKTLDLRNADSLLGIGYMPFGVETLYVKATILNLQGLARTVINFSPNGGTLWINPNDTYAADVIAAAEAKGWTIYNL